MSPDLSAWASRIGEVAKPMLQGLGRSESRLEQARSIVYTGGHLKWRPRHLNGFGRAIVNVRRCKHKPVMLDGRLQITCVAAKQFTPYK